MMRQLAALVVVVGFGFGCSIMDPGDRDELRNQIAMMPASKQSLFKRWFMNDRAQRWLERKRRNDQVGKIQCRDNEGGAWSDWYDRPDKILTVEDMINCLTHKADFLNYIECAGDFEEWVGEAARNELKTLLKAFTDVECRYVWDPRYEPDKVDAKAVDPAAVTEDDEINAMIRLPAPPPGWGFPELVPYLCPLGAGPGWGCPPRPSDPTGGQPTEPTGGDHP